MNWDGIFEFVAVIEQRSFTRAAEKLQISTAKVSRQVTALEKRLDSKLLNRTTRIVTPTDIGLQFYHQCRQITELLDDAQRLVSEQQHTPKGHLKLTAPVTYGERFIAPLLNDFALLYPGLRIQLELTNKVLDLVEESYDMGIRLGHLEDSTLRARKLGSRKLHTCASSAYLDSAGVPQRIDELKKHHCVAGTSSHWQFTVDNNHKTFRPSPRMRCNSGFAVRDAALKGLGIIQLPDYYVAKDIAEKRLLPVLTEYDTENDGIWAVYPQSRHVPNKVRLLVDYLVKNL
ncbi:LysR substrate-binding domain-containing protein [Aestuariibacter sp. A3R04]|uniref:LysR substrate-binding domain-containing protein n=1 Tax=Aestuariibacter sp. A3R04 TaxID=2841571 RepID=UPI001C09F8DB|nr:LysR substrate-binding domain-containing protein [Aestuariibacter sp. A3R04]MBU3020544.1 LysR family transcriptional regulator [Aestuariibacter sp. A3R04]